MKRQTILIALENQSLRQHLKGLLLDRGYQVIEPHDQSSVLIVLRKNPPNLVIVGSWAKSVFNGLEIAKEIHCYGRQIPIILITENSSEELAIAALKAKINDYFRVPLSFEELVLSVNRCLSDVPREPSRHNGSSISNPIKNQAMIGNSQTMLTIKAYIEKIAWTNSSVLITGETGTGKELVAELIHQNSPRHQNLFLPINCAAIPDGLLESELFGYERGAFTGADSLKEGQLGMAKGGSVFLDEIGDMSPFAQAKILRVLESKEIRRLGGKGNIPLDLRFMAATNLDIEELVSQNKFRKDLYFRLNVVRIHLPPLRERKEDIPVLFDYYIRELNRRFGQGVEGFTEEALEELMQYNWPGNVRELKNLLEAIFINLPPRKISLVDLPEQFRRRLGDTGSLPKDERSHLVSMLFSSNWNISKAAQQLRWSRMTVYRKMAKYHIIRMDESQGCAKSI